MQRVIFHVDDWPRTAAKCREMENARTRRAKRVLLSIVKYAYFFCCCRRRHGGRLRSPMSFTFSQARVACILTSHYHFAKCE